MREYLKNDLLEIVKTMRELCDVVLQECERENTSYLLELLEQGQQAAISIGETIEKLEGEGTEAVAALEEFCEHMYFLSENAGKEMVSVSKEKRILDKLILHIENGIRHLPSIYEIVFLPYKASMWDCMESIYFAAAKDPECNVSVVSIPYFDIDKNEQFGQMHYEGDMFPEQIPIISWKDYKISEHRPDIVYIHNPFDRYNLVTSVHPDYYSDQLKKYTGKLVYIPYGISRLIVPEGHLQLPTYENMDYIVIQSRKQEKYYKDKIFDGKLLPLGSPKFDRVISYQKNGVEMPAEWDKVLDGRTKFFYNTSLSALLEDTEAALKKIEYVFCCFENREDTVLIWRPHPLIESTLMSMRPQYLKWYQELVQRFCQNKIGILDKTADMSKTIALCDAYIGENASSVVDLFCALGKPLFILDMKIDRKLSEAEFCDSLFCNVEYYEGQYWTFSYQFNALCTMNMETGELKMVDTIPKYDLLKRGLVSNIYGYHDKLIFSPNSMDSIAEYDLATREFTFYKLPDALVWGNTAGIISYKDDFFLLPRNYPAIIQYNAQKKKYIFHRQVMEEIMKLASDKEYADGRAYFGGCTIKKELLFVSLVRTNAVLIWHMDTCKYEIVHIGNEKNLYGAIAEVKDGFLLRLYEGAKLLFWNPQTGETRDINQFPDAFEYRLNPREEVHPFGGFLILSSYLLLMPQLGNQILRIDRETLEISIYEMDWKDHMREPQEGIFDNQWGCLRAVLIPDRTKVINQDFNEVYLVTSADGCMLKLNLDTHQYMEVQTGFDIDDLKKLFPIEELYEKFEIPIKSREDMYHTLDDFINAMVEGRINKFNNQQIQVYSQISANLDGTCGEKVHKAVKKAYNNDYLRLGETMNKQQSSADYMISGKQLKAAGKGVYEDQWENKIEFSSDIEDNIQIHLSGRGNYVKLGKITSVNDYKISDKMRKIWQVELAMLDKVDTICKKHDIQYFLLNGTLLGAVRHKGFIPWDDDLDIGMLRKDYDRFMEIAQRELEEPYFIQNIWTDKNCFFGGFSKLRNGETTGITARELGHDCNLGIWIDIMPLDYCTTNEKLLSLKEKKINKAYQWLCARVYGNEMKRFGKVPAWLWKIMATASHMIPYQQLCQKLEHAIRLYTEPSKDIAVFTGHGKHRILNSADFETTTQLEFEGRNVPVPSGYKNYLFMIWGKDYMKFPPVEERKPKHTGIYDPEHSYRKYLQRLTGMFEGCKGKKIILFGSGMMFEDYMKKWGNRYRPVFLVDNDENKWNRSRMGIEIKPPKALLEIPVEKQHLIICSFYYKEIEKQLQEMGITNYHIYIQKLEWIVNAEA